ncbi:MAG TPA: RNA polymerase subunit sigma-70, partial [Streptomyces sp.]
TVAAQAATFRALAPFARIALINGTVGAVVVAPTGQRISIMAFTVTDGAITTVEVVADPDRLRTMDLTALGL